MRVKCERFISQSGAKRGQELVDLPVETFPRVGDEYLALAIRCYAKPPQGLLPADVLVEDELGEPTWVPIAMFSVKDDTLSRRWTAHIRADGQLDLTPSAWARDHFWRDFHSDDAHRAKPARETYCEEAALIRSEAERLA